MRVRSVTAHAFGPLVDQTLTFADGLTVVYGPNESAKSSWHAATYAALCGRRRRGGGSAGEDDRRFRSRHQPWDRREWRVSAEITLDGAPSLRRIALRQDLADRIACDAVDLGLGRDCSAEIIHDGTPDAARWLGLDRESFRAIAWVPQAEILGVVRRADGLREYLQRATAGGVDHTAATAIATLDRFRAERVGTLRAPTRPLRQAMDAVNRARAHLAEIRAEHDEYQKRLVEVAKLQAGAEAAKRRLRLWEAAAAKREADRLCRQSEEAERLHDRLGGTAPVSAADEEARARRVAAALSAWSARPELPDRTTGVVVDDIDQGVSADELWSLAAALSVPVPHPDPELTRRVDAAQERLTLAVRIARRGRAVALAGLAAAFVGAVAAAVAFVAAGGPAAIIAGAAATALAGALVGTGLAVRLRAGEGAARAELEEARVALAAALRAEETARAREEAARSRAARLGLPCEPAALRELARARTAEVATRDRDQEWLREVAEARERAAAEVMAAAAECGLAAATPQDAVAALQRWQDEHAARAAALATARDEWVRLTTLLDGRGLAQLRQAAQEAQERAARAAEPFDAAEVDAVPAVSEEELQRLRGQAQAAVTAAAEAEGECRALEARLIPVAEAEEACAQAEAELRRLKDLDATLQLTRDFLAAAAERAHTAIAPLLAGSVQRWLGHVTGGRYTEVSVNADDLRVRVRGPGGWWRDAEALSYGTAEQVYLLLRVALAEHLARNGESCPLLLDEVTVHADADRTRRLLEVLHQVSRERQVVIFTQQELVRDWARDNLDGERDALRELSPVPVA